MSAENLLLHYVSDGEPSRRLTLSRAELRALIEARLERGPARRLDEYLRRADPPTAPAFTISFDDAHRSVLEHAAPILEALDVPATLFVPTAFVETSTEFLGWDDLRRLRDAGWTLGSHTASHPRMGWRLYDEDEAAHLARLVREVEVSREQMERELGEAPRLFAYPFGEAPSVARRAAERAGVEAAFTVAAECDWDGDRLAIPRVDAAPGPSPASDSPSGFSVIVPAFDRARVLSDVVTRLASQSYPEERYELIVVDDGSTGDITPIFDEMPDNVRLLRQGDDSFRAGQARQRGADEAKHDHLVFLDADVAVDEDFLWHLDWVHRRVEDAVILGYLSGYNLHDMGYLHTPHAVIGQSLGELPIIPDRSREPTLRACLDNLDWLDDPWPLTYTGNLSVSRALFERAGGFADDFVGWGLEDVDLGIRLHRGGGRFVFGRFAHGVHVVDPGEEGWRNPFREKKPTRELFEGYLENLTTLARRHPGDDAVQAYVARSHADIEETCSRPYTVGIEFGGASRWRSPWHARLHRVQPGGVPRHELLDRVAYARKVDARTLYLLGGEPSEHDAFLDLLRAARPHFEWISMLTLGHAFASPGLAKEAREAGLRGATIELLALDEATHDAHYGAGAFARLEAGLDALREAGIETDARLVVTPRTLRDLERTLARASDRALKVEELALTDPTLEEAVAAIFDGPIHLVS